MDDRHIPTKKEFDSLMDWLSGDGQEAGEHYEKIRQGLIRFFEFKGCANGEELADETINRVARKLPDLDVGKGNRPVTIFYGFARNVFRESLKRSFVEVPVDDSRLASVEEPGDETADLMDFLERCLQRLSETERETVLQYYSRDKSLKFEHRRKLAGKLNLTMGALHIRIYRIRRALRACVERAAKLEGV